MRQRTTLFFISIQLLDFGIIDESNIDSVYLLNYIRIYYLAV